ncbi:cytochrome p450 [Colletotrichum plurivorum]|uniref:Cytochrome p450 n=1 Tax=Colletotrichum plurivorum TaxID=2175906 RepID=A0A8H6N3Q1_9PEZI|nr:cytochrome p450 [Colletotrichum plurivorum]
MTVLNASTTILVGAFIVVLYAVFGQAKLRRNGTPLRRPPNTLPLFGNGINFLRDRQKLLDWFTECERLHGYETLQITVPTLPAGVIISDPKNLDYVFKNEGIIAKGDFFKVRSRDLFGNGIINVDGDLWKVQRKAGLNFLNTSNLKLLTDVFLPQYLSQSVTFLRRKANSGLVVDLQAVFHEITTQLMGRMAYNMEMHADDEFAVAFDYASGATAERFQNPLWFVTEMMNGSRLRKSIKIVKSFGQNIVSSATNDRKTRPQPTITNTSGKLAHVSGSLVQSLLDSVGDEKLVADAALNYLSAGRDTTAQALTWTFYLLMKHPDVVERIREEIDQVTADGGNPLEEVISERCSPATTPYTLAVFCEALRLFPPIPFEIKQVVRATSLPDGTFLPQNSVIVWCTWAMNRSRITWGVDADQFRPERWLVDGRVAIKSPSEYPVFNGGPRTCLGKRMAEVIAVQVIATVTGLFDFARVDRVERVSKSSLTLPMKDGLPCVVLHKSYRQ